MRLRLATQIYGTSAWVEVARHVPGRLASHCANRFWEVEFEGLKRFRSDDPSRSKRGAFLPWTEEEDSTLLREIEHYGAGNWCLIRKGLPGRSLLDCFRRFQKLNPSNMADMYDILLATQGKMIPRWFLPVYTAQKRKRSELVASDFALQLFEVPEEKAGDGDGSSATPFTMLTTGDRRIDKHLLRVNQRRRKRYREMSKCVGHQLRSDERDDQDSKPKKHGPFAKRRRRKGRRISTSGE